MRWCAVCERRHVRRSDWRNVLLLMSAVVRRRILSARYDYNIQPTAMAVLIELESIGEHELPPAEMSVLVLSSSE